MTNRKTDQCCYLPMAEEPLWDTCRPVAPPTITSLPPRPQRDRIHCYVSAVIPPTVNVKIIIITTTTTTVTRRPNFWHPLPSCNPMCLPVRATCWQPFLSLVGVFRPMDPCRYFLRDEEPATALVALLSTRKTTKWKTKEMITKQDKNDCKRWRMICISVENSKWHWMPGRNHLTWLQRIRRVLPSGQKSFASSWICIFS
mmetsp:Transcript_6772/g.11777  ORF Transcript_6772/g.11777 Transcript_6772/m.11777 type:complete len:200 (-) Transcript_6772:1079-1678(-)